jgi:hypothetical protein
MRLRGYFEDEAVNCTLQMQVRREAKKLKGIASPSAAAVLSAVAAMVALSTTVTTRALATILPEDNDGSPVLSLLSPPKKTRYMSHQRQVNRQNKQKAKEAYAQALASAMMLIAAERGKEKENTCPPLSISNRFWCRPAKNQVVRAAAEELAPSVTVANTCKQQEALAKATAYGKKFYVTGGEHINSDYMFIGAEMGNRESEIPEMEKNKKVWIEFHARRDAALVVLNRLHHESDGNIESLSNKELEVLLRWKGVPVSKMGNMASRRALYKQFAGDRGDNNLGDPAQWRETVEANFEARRNAPIEMGDTA